MVVHALTRIGAVIVPLNVRQSSSELLWQINDSKPSLVLYDELFSHVKEEIGKKGSKFHWKSLRELEETSRANKDVEGGIIIGSVLHSIIYTSGSTGTPKGVMITASNLMWNAISFGMYHGALPSDRWLLVMPLFHVGGYTIIFRSVLHGSSIVVHSKFDAAAVSRSIDKDGITLVSLVPTMLENLLRARNGRSFPGNLRLIFLGGSHTPPSLMRQIERKKLPVLLTYGMTESCSQIAISTVRSDQRRSGQQNSYHAMFSTVMAIRRFNADRKSWLTVSRGKVGRIVLRGPSIFSGYWGNHSTALEDGWFHTGDLGYMDSGGGIVVLGREKDMIISGGENIYPIEVESPLLEHSAIEEAIVIGKEDPKWGQRVEAVVKVKQGFDLPSASELTEFLRKKIGSYKIPKAYHFLDAFPKTQSGKTKREAIIEIIEKGNV